MKSEVDVGDPVRAQYEHWIYPEPIPDLAASQSRSLGDPAFLGQVYWPDRCQRDDLNILVAGCGPNAAARFAFHHPKASVVGIDISESSLAHARFLKGKHHLDNLTLQNCRIEEAGNLGQAFDLIQCYGALHHLPDPSAGLKALGNVLAADGVAFVMVYAKYGRAGIYMAQEIFRLLGVEQSQNGVALVKQALTQFKADHPLHQQTLDDARFDSGIVDLFLHRLDSPFTVAGCLELVDSAGLVFQGWLENFPYYPEGQIMAGSLFREQLDRLPECELWKVMELFFGKITRHNFYVCRRDRDPSRYRIEFESERLLDMVPVLSSDVIRTPGPNAIKLTRSSFNEITLREAQAALVMQVDGQRTIRECFNAAGIHAASPELEISFCRGIFRTLWRIGYSRLVFKASIG